jgi:hypothetical protein
VSHSRQKFQKIESRRRGVKQTTFRNSGKNLSIFTPQIESPPNEDCSSASHRPEDEATHLPQSYDQPTHNCVSGSGRAPEKRFSKAIPGSEPGWLLDGTRKPLGFLP